MNCLLTFHSKGEYHLKRLNLLKGEGEEELFLELKALVVELMY